MPRMNFVHIGYRSVGVVVPLSVRGDVKREAGSVTRILDINY